MTHPARWFAVASAVLLMCVPFASRILASAGGVDLTLHATYFVLPPSLVCLAMAALLALFSGSYALFGVRPRVAAWHFWLTVGSIVVFWLSFYLWGAWAGGRLGVQSVTAPATSTLEVAIAATFLLSALVVLLSPAILILSLALEWTRRRRLSPG